MAHLSLPVHGQVVKIHAECQDQSRAQSVRHHFLGQGGTTPDHSTPRPRRQLPPSHTKHATDTFTDILLFSTDNNTQFMAK